MTDIVERLRNCTVYEDGWFDVDEVNPIVREAADEIERLRRDCAVDVSELYREIERLRTALYSVDGNGPDVAFDRWWKLYPRTDTSSRKSLARKAYYAAWRMQEQGK